MGGLKYIGIAILAVVLVGGFGIQMGSTMPDNAILLLHIGEKIYYSPTYLRDFGISAKNLVAFKRKDIIGKGYKPDSKCRNAGYFMAEDDASIIVCKVKKLLGMNRKRWNEDGSWNW